MKNLIFLSVLFLGLFSCQDSLIDESKIETNETVEITPELQQILGDVQTREEIWPKNVYDLTEFLNKINFTPEGYEKCLSPMLTIEYSVANYDPETQTSGELIGNPEDYEYTFFEMASIAQSFLNRAKEECDGDAFVITATNFQVNFTTGGGYRYIDVEFEICCDPVINEVPPKGPQHNHELTVG